MVDQVQLYVLTACYVFLARGISSLVGLTLLPPSDVLSAALDSGVAISAILIFFCLQYPMNGDIGKNTIQTWWGNTVSFNNADGAGAPLRPLAPGGVFG